MKKTLGIVALTLIMGVPAFAANNSSVIYTLQVGGSNAGGPNAQFNTTGVHEPTDAILDMGTTATPDILTWSVRVTVSGEIDGTVVGGAANLVWDLTLKGPDGQPVGPGFGLSNGSTPGFFSTIMNGGGGFPIQPASFTWEYGGGAPFGRLIDAYANNGVNMLQYTFPSTYQYYLAPTASVPNTTTVGATTGTLMGMGAGYPDLDPANGSERTGVGILAASDGTYSYTCFMDIGAKGPIAEGQINLAGMPGGTYTLVLTPGLGNNVISTAACDFGTTGAFASAAGSTGTGSTIAFIHQGGVVGPTPVVSGGAVSNQFHTGIGYLGTPLFATTIPTAGSNAVSEPRRPSGANPWTIDVTFDLNLGPAPTVVATGTNGNPTLGAPMVTGNVLSIPITAYNDVNCITLSITNVTSATGSLPNAAPYVIEVVALQGDVNGSRSVNNTDRTIVGSQTGIAVTLANCRDDVNCSGGINNTDRTIVGSKTGGSVTCTYP